MKIVASLTVSAVLIVGAVVLYFYAYRHDTTTDHYRDTVSIVRQIQQLDVSWSMEAARVEADPLADFDSLAAFIPQMNRLSDELSDTIRPIPDLPVELSNEINSYLSAVDAKEERIERFKTSYAVVRNSVRYLPLAATNLLRLADQSAEQRLAQDISRLTQDVNTYLVTPSEPEQERLTGELAVLREQSVAARPQVSNALANYIAHAEVLVARKMATDTIFEEATDTDISERTERIVADLEFHAERAAQQARFFELGVVGTLVALVLLWGGMAFFRVVETPVARRSRASDVARAPAPAPASEGVSDDARPAVAAEPEPPAPVPVVAPPEPTPVAPRAGTIPDAEAMAVSRAAPTSGPPETAAAVPPLAAREAAPPAPLPLSEARRTPEARALHRIVTGFVSSSLTDSVHQVLTRLDHLQQSQDRIQNAVRAGGMAPLATGMDFDEEIDTSFAVLASIRRQVDEVDALAQRLASFSKQRDAEISYELINIEACVEEACEAVRADQYAAVTKTIGPVPDIFASRYDILLLVEYILENAVLSVQELDGRGGMIKIDVTHRNEDILITVVDNGDGFEADLKGKIFEPFYTTREDALGIGLPSAVYLAGKYRGTVSANSLPGEGTVFRITLPAGVTAQGTA
ncbi:MAG: ATP-binding protein [Rhodospirillales bacterium]|nr:ATP-binding protein [Rhodospirillales bacterium]